MATKQQAARSTAIAWRRSLKAIGVPLDGIHVRTVYKRPAGYRYSEPQFKCAFPPESTTEQIKARADEFAELVAASGWSAYVVLRSTATRHPYIEISNVAHALRDDDVLLASTANGA